MAWLRQEVPRKASEGNARRGEVSCRRAFAPRRKLYVDPEALDRWHHLLACHQPLLTAAWSSWTNIAFKSHRPRLSPRLPAPSCKGPRSCTGTCPASRHLPAPSPEMSPSLNVLVLWGNYLLQQCSSAGQAHNGNAHQWFHLSSLTALDSVLPNPKTRQRRNINVASVVDVSGGQV